ncbi:MAG: hypothetical protein WC736_15835 [Gallionella sp.]|jgi:hypothetical protein
MPNVPTPTNRTDPPVGVITTTDGTLAQSDTTNLAQMVRWIRVSGAGNVKITGYDGVAATLAFLAGETRFVAATRIWTTGTTATGIEGML